jgi:hypothetical protein
LIIQQQKLLAALLEGDKKDKQKISANNLNEPIDKKEFKQFKQWKKNLE